MDPSPRIRRIAGELPTRNFRETLKAFTAPLISIAHDSQSQRVYLSPQVDLKHRTGVRPRDWIRRVLERIRFLVRGGASS